MWWKDLTVNVLTLLERVDNLGKKLAEAVASLDSADKALERQVSEANQHISRLEGIAQSSPTQELMRQVAELQRRVTMLEATRTPGIVIDASTNRHAPSHQIEPPQIDGGNGQ